VPPCQQVYGFEWNACGVSAGRDQELLLDSYSMSGLGVRTITSYCTYYYNSILKSRELRLKVDKDSGIVTECFLVLFWLMRVGEALNHVCLTSDPALFLWSAVEPENVDFRARLS
jgi:hypothetical protein